MLHIGVLREYLEMDLRPRRAMSFKYDAERIIDDFVLMTFLCGNDFVPHLPSLDIGEGALDTLFAVYRETLPALGGYLTHQGDVDTARLEVPSLRGRGGGTHQCHLTLTNTTHPNRFYCVLWAPWRRRCSRSAKQRRSGSRSAVGEGALRHHHGNTLLWL